MHSSNRLSDNLQSGDDIVDSTIGFGRWQFVSILVLCIAIFFHMLNSGTDAIMRPEGWWCKKPNFLKNWTNTEWIMYSHSSDSCVGICNRKLWDAHLLADGYFRGCSIYNISYEKLSHINYTNRPLIEIIQTIPCPYGIDYSNDMGQNLAEKYNVGCNDGAVVSNMWQSSSSFGKIFGYIVMGVLSDKFGRKIIFFISCAATPLCAIIIATSNYYILFVIVSIIHGFFDGGFSICFILIIEISTNTKRSIVLAFTCFIFAVGIGLTTTVNYLFLSYDTMLLCTNGIFFLMFIFIRFLPESPSWLFCCHEINKLENWMKNGIRYNKASMSSNFKLIYIESGDDRYKLPIRKPDIWNIIAEPEIAYEVIGISYLMILYGIIFGSSTYEILAAATKSHLANSLLAMAIVIGVSCGQACLLLMGHRKTLQISLVLVLISSIMLTIDLHDLKPTSTGPTVTLLLINIATVSLSYGVLLNYNARTIPTLLRGTLFGIWKAIWELFVWIGNHDYYKFPTTAFTAIFTCVLALLISLNVKDIYNRELPDTIFDSICFDWKNKPKRWNVEEINQSSLKRSTNF